MSPRLPHLIFSIFSNKTTKPSKAWSSSDSSSIVSLVSPTNQPTNSTAASDRLGFRSVPDMEPPRVMEVHPAMTEEDPTSALWDFEDLLDFTVDGHFSMSLDPDQLPSPPPQPPPPIIDQSLDFSQEDSRVDTDPPGPSSGKIRKRDPRLTCTNYLAGRIPCACPEMDEKLEMEGSLRGKKRSRTVRVSNRTARCQVPGCEADISELKGYHRRHRVCLRCANASEVFLDGDTKRYCQQCGK